ncbi:cytochrome b [Mesorhizobium sp. 8]|uniref:cytochrome b n=1 Tax=Mesorhizobium sp. 8 TaxID=2584466 RepID=UPI0011208CD3|nr:cytochrome b [Mesorhizobium sp. 8]QDC01785.1 cytochrome b [Mesorhizobium sp. 8]
MALLFRNTPTRYGWIAILLHWLIAVLFIGQVALGLVMVRIASQRTAFELIQWHKSFGFLLLGLVLVRIGWRLGNVRPALPETVAPIERRAAPLVHALLYAAQLIVPLSGWALVSVSMLEVPSVPFDLFVMPNLPLGASDAAEAFWSVAHEWLAWIGIALAALHILAALRHRFLLRDSVFQRMIAPSSGDEPRE